MPARVAAVATAARRRLRCDQSSELGQKTRFETCACVRACLHVVLSCMSIGTVPFSLRVCARDYVKYFIPVAQCQRDS